MLASTAMPHVSGLRAQGNGPQPAPLAPHNGNVSGTTPADPAQGLAAGTADPDCATAVVNNAAIAVVADALRAASNHAFPDAVVTHVATRLVDLGLASSAASLATYHACVAAMDPQARLQTLGSFGVDLPYAPLWDRMYGEGTHNHAFLNPPFPASPPNRPCTTHLTSTPARPPLHSCCRHSKRQQRKHGGRQEPAAHQARQAHPRRAGCVRGGKDGRRRELLPRHCPQRGQACRQAHHMHSREPDSDACRGESSYHYGTALALQPARPPPS